MKICIIGAGAIGGLLAVKLAQCNQTVSLITRGLHLQVIKKNGIKLIDENGTEEIVKIFATDSVSEVGIQDLIILAVKAHQIVEIVRDLPLICESNTMILSVQNGIPWWYFFKLGSPFDGLRLESVDPDGLIAENIPTNQVIASIVYIAAHVIQPGIIKRVEGNRISLAEIDRSKTARIQIISKMFQSAGFKAPVVTDIRHELWIKLWGNLSLNPISALTHATLEEICRFIPTREVAAAMMLEAKQIAEGLGVRFYISVEKRLQGAGHIGQHKTSMLQDIEAGRSIEINALLGSVIELGNIVGVRTPHLNTVFACASLLNKILQEKEGHLRIEKFSQN